VSVIDTRTYQVTDTVPLGNFPADVAIDEATHTAYITSSSQGWCRQLGRVVA